MGQEPYCRRDGSTEVVEGQMEADQVSKGRHCIRDDLTQVVVVQIDLDLSGMLRRSVSLAIPHRRSFAMIPRVSLVLLGHTNRSVLLSHESQHEIALV